MEWEKGTFWVPLKYFVYFYVHVCYLHAYLYTTRVEDRRGWMELECRQLWAAVPVLGSNPPPFCKSSKCLSLRNHLSSPLLWGLDVSWCQAKGGLTGHFSCFLSFWKFPSLCYPECQRCWWLLHYSLDGEDDSSATQILLLFAWASQPQNSLFGSGDSLLWRTVLCIIGCLAAPLSSSRVMLRTLPPSPTLCTCTSTWECACMHACTHTHSN